MPTIDELPAAISVGDSDEFIISQDYVALKATRAQVISGVQPALAVPQNNLLGRLSVGTGSPENIAIGANLSTVGGTLSAPAPFVISSLPSGSAPGNTDLVPISQGGVNAAVSYSQFIGSFSQVPGLVGSGLLVQPNGGVGVRALASILSDAISIESFGAVGDGITDDTAAFQAAIASGRPLQLDGRVYVINGTLNFSLPASIVGITGTSVLRRLQVSADGTWITASGGSFSCIGVVFDSGGLFASNSPCLFIAQSCTRATLVDCQFINAANAGSGNGVILSGTADTVASFSGCGFANNFLAGFSASGGGSVSVSQSVFARNGACGLDIDSLTSCDIGGSSFINNGYGVLIGNWNSPPQQGAAGPICVFQSNILQSNANWGLCIGASGAIVCNNQVLNNGTVSAGGGILARLGLSSVYGNTIDSGACGIDARGAWACLISDNQISGTTTAIALGGSQNVKCSSNYLLNNGWGIVVTAIEPTISFSTTAALTLSENWIGFTTAQGGGIRLLDGVQTVTIANNDFATWGGAGAAQVLWVHTDSAIIIGNRWNGLLRFTVQSSIVANLPALVVPDSADEVLVTSAPPDILSLLTAHQVATLGQITFIKVNSGGAGYTQATVTISGSGVGATASAIVYGGSVLWIVITNPGSGYGEIGNGAGVLITGDGSGATATAYVGLPVIEARTLRLLCSTPVRLVLSGSSPPFQSWTDFDSTIPIYGDARLEGLFGQWCATTFPPVDYILPNGAGGVTLQSVSGGNVILRPASGGAIHLSSSAEQTGATSSVGRGSPLGSVSAPPGSDFRNLNGGAGNTFWVKQSGTDSSGWVAVA
jgi:hypothetical protein